MKDKVPKDLAYMVSASVHVHPSSTPLVEEAASALVNLGYRRLESIAAIHKAQQELGQGANLNDLIRQGLAFVTRGAA